MISRSEAKQLAQNATPDQIKEMLAAAREGVKDWTKCGSNRSLDLGTTFNIFWCEDDKWDGRYRSALCRQNAIHNFGEFFPNRVKPVKTKREFTIHHEEPVEIHYEARDLPF